MVLDRMSRPTCNSWMYHTILYTPRGATATAKGTGTIEDRHSENCEGQVGRFVGFLAFFCLQRI